MTLWKTVPVQRQARRGPWWRKGLMCNTISNKDFKKLKWKLFQFLLSICNQFKHNYLNVISDCSRRVNSPGCFDSLSLILVSSDMVCNFRTRTDLENSFCFMCYVCLLETGSVSVTKGLGVAIRWRSGKEATCLISLWLVSVSVLPSASPRGLMFISQVGIPKSFG